jgi:hypothetical protein
MGYPAKDKEIAKRPEANKGGREEEEKRFGQTTERNASQSKKVANGSHGSQPAADL